MEEEWRWIDGAEGKYEVSESGQVRSYARGGNGRMLKPRTHNGYKIFSLQIGGKARPLPAHRIVARAFHPEGSGPLVRHIDGNPLNNHYTNLAWGTYAENNADIVTHGRQFDSTTRTACRRGHEYTDESTRWAKGRNERICKTCKHEADRRYRERRVKTPERKAFEAEYMREYRTR